MNPGSSIHFHVRIVEDPIADWQAFPTRGTADYFAQMFGYTRGPYQIEEYDHSCSRCAEFRKHKKVIDCDSPVGSNFPRASKMA